MNQPVRVGLVFSRSGQQLSIQVPHHIAERLEQQYGEHQAGYRIAQQRTATGHSAELPSIHTA